ncbi:MAG: glycosyltransferase [Zoogloeaceae bacterium]|jgi:glycosyltransferase involved in cell wall biosynthesis|nr:glycosyltransferase [Zoogloeaceae bacterium]
MKISIITVCFNAADTITATLRSVAAQTHQEAEHIVVDGGSTDGTLEHIAKHGKHVAHLVSEPDKGIYDAMNKGIRLASGDIIGILNADDIYADDAVLTRVANVMADGGFDALYGDVEFFAPDNPKKATRRYNSRRFSPAKLAWGWMPAHPTLFLRRELFERYGLYRTDFRISGDYELIARIFKEGKLKYRYLPEVLVRMRTGGVSTSGWRNTLLLNREVLRACSENGIKTNWFKLLSKYPLKALEFLRK